MTNFQADRLKVAMGIIQSHLDCRDYFAKRVEMLDIMSDITVSASSDCTKIIRIAKEDEPRLFDSMIQRFREAFDTERARAEVSIQRFPANYVEKGG